MTEKAFDLNMHTARLLMAEPFFAALSRKIDKKSSDLLPTAGVKINEETGQFEMLYNPEFFASLPDDQKLGVLKHEFYHLIFEHVTGRMPEGKMSKMWNVATDLAINSHIANELPEQALVPGVGNYSEFPTGKSAEYYYNLLKENEKEEEGEGDGESSDSDDSDENKEGNGQGKPGQGDDSLDDHSGWGEASAEAKEIAKQRLKESLKQASQEADKSNNWGSVSSSMRREIKDRLIAKLDWRKVLRYFIKTSERANKTSSIKRVNRRYAYIHPGKKVKRQARIAISIDQSGSVDDKMLAAFYAELNKLADLAEFTVIPFDDEVFEEKVYVWTKGTKRKKERVLCGGTDFDAPTEFVNKGNYDGHIVLTDMYAPKPKRSKCQRMWMTSQYCANHPYFQTHEKIIAIDC